MSKKGLTPKWFFILVVTATLLYYEQLFPRASVWISDAMQHSQKMVWIYANKLYILNFFKNTEPNWFDLQLVHARFKFFFKFENTSWAFTHAIFFFFFLRVPVFWSIAL